MTNRVTFSAVVLVKNEELNLPGLLSNLAGWVDQIILVDDESTDRTPEIAATAGDHVLFMAHPMTEEGGFAGQRNAGLAAATGDWVLNLDCDERVTDALKRELMEKVRDENLMALRYRRLNYFMNRPMHHGGWETWNRPQIARRGAHRFVGKVHEACEIDGEAHQIGQLEHPMHHLNDHNFTQRLRKSQQYSAMEADKLAKTGQRVTGRSLMLEPIKTFLKLYVAKQGFRDGVPGLIAALHSATSTFRIRVLVWEQQNPKDRIRIEDMFRG